MRKLWAVIQREYVERVRTKAFVIGTLVGPLLLLGITVLPTWLSLRDRKATPIADVEILDATGTSLGERVARALRDSAGTSGAAEPSQLPRVVIVPPSGLAAAESLATRGVMRGGRRGYLVLDSATLAGTRARYAGRNATSIRDVERVRGIVRQAVLAYRLEREGLDVARINTLTGTRLRMSTERITERGRGGSGAGNVIFATVVAVMLYSMILLYGQFVLRGVVEEKQTRVSEVVLSSVRPETLLAGKVLGIGAVGLTQALAWVVLSGVLGSYIAPFLGGLARDAARDAGSAQAPLSAAEAAVGLPSVSPGTVVAFVLFFVLGYLFYASLFAAVGAMVNSDQEAQQAATPVMMLVITSVLFVQPVILNPTSAMAKTVSWIPFTAPIIMPMRMSLVSVPPLEVAAVLAGLALACVLAVWLAARIYRVGLLMYGKRPSMRELVRWVRYA